MWSVNVGRVSQICVVCVRMLKCVVCVKGHVEMCEVCGRCSIEVFVEEMALECVFENLTLNVYCLIYEMCAVYGRVIVGCIHVLDSVSST